MSQDDPAEQQTGGGEPAAGPAGGRLRALWSVPTYRFALLYLAFLIAIGLIYPSLAANLSPVSRAAEAHTAEMVYHLLSWFSPEVELREQHRQVIFGHFPVKIVWECTGFLEALLLGPALLAFPTTWPKIAIGFLIGFPLIWAMNIARIAALLAVGRYVSGASFEFVHVYFWQVTMILMVVSTWLIWVLWVVRGSGLSSAPRDASG